MATPEGAAVMLYGLAWPAGRLLVVCWWSAEQATCRPLTALHAQALQADHNTFPPVGNFLSWVELTHLHAIG